MAILISIEPSNAIPAIVLVAANFVAVPARPSMLTPVNDCEAEALVNVTNVVPIYKDEFAKTVPGIVPVNFDPARPVIHAGLEYAPVVTTPLVTVLALPYNDPVTLPVTAPVTFPVTAPVTFPVTFPVRLPDTFPVRLPNIAAVIVPAEKLPKVSLFTMLEGSLATLGINPRN